jgi:hypothetical protein
MARTLIPLLLILHSGCDDKSSRSRPSEPDVKKQPLPAEVMRAMIAPGEPCIRKFRSTMPEAYVARAWVNRSPEGFLTIEFRAGDQVEFNACIADAIRAARIPVELAGPVEVPLAFDFKNPGA